MRLLKRIVRRSEQKLDDYFFSKLHAPVRLMLILLFVGLASNTARLPKAADDWLAHLLLLIWIGAVAWLLINVSLFMERALTARIHEGDNLRMRKMLTQFTVLQRILAVVVALFALGAMLMSFEQVRNLGMSLLASAGVAGIIVGFSAQKTIASVLAGIQIAFTQPIRLDDVVIVENEWGRVEEITFTYVVIRIWDQRRLVVPIAYFLEKPFQNWTRVSSDLLGTVYLYVDYATPVQELRTVLQHICEEDAGVMWDKRVCSLQVTDTTKEVMELRCLVSAANSSMAWDLRCLVREKLVTWLAEHHPNCLPRARVELEKAPDF